MEKKIKRVFTSLKNRTENVGSGNRNGGSQDVDPADDTPEGNLLRATNGFCETKGTENPYSSEEYVFLPSIVDIAESSPSAAALAATTIRKNLDIKNASRPYVQYNSIMLMRILAQNPGPTFTRNLNDPKFGVAVKDLLRQGRDPGVRQILRETLSHFAEDPDRIADEGLNLLREVWTKEKKKVGGPQFTSNSTPPPAAPLAVANPASAQPYTTSPPPPRPILPPVQELVARISEANTSAKLLEQVLQSTPQAEIVSNELIKEFVDRCKLAHQSMKTYISADNPPPDEDTLTTLIETHDAISVSLEKHRNAVAAALKASETTGNENSRLVDLGDLRTQDAVMHGAAVNFEDDNDEHSNTARPVSPVSQIDQTPPPTNTATQQQPITYRF